MAMCDTESLAVAEQQLMEEMLDQENLKQALKRVMQNKVPQEIDGMTVDKLPAYLAASGIPFAMNFCRARMYRGQ